MAQLRSRIARDATKSLLLTILGIGLMVGGAMAGGDTAREVGRRRRRHGHGRQRHGDALDAERAPVPGIGGRPGRPAPARGHAAVGARHAGDVRALRRAGVLVSPRTSTRSCAAIQSRPIGSTSCATGWPRAPMRTQGSARTSAAPRHDARQARRPHAAHADCVFNRYPASNNSLPARYARAIARNCSGGCAQALPEIDALIRDKPDNPYFWELKGELLLKAGQHGRGDRPAAQGGRPAGEAQATRTRRSPTRRPRSCWAAPWSRPTILACWTRR